MDTVSAMSCNVLSRGASFGGGAIRDMPLSPKCGAWDVCGDELDPLKRRADGDSGSRAIHPLPLLRLVGDIRLERLVYRTCSWPPAPVDGRPCPSPLPFVCVLIGEGVEGSVGSELLALEPRALALGGVRPKLRMGESRGLRPRLDMVVRWMSERSHEVESQEVGLVATVTPGTDDRSPPPAVGRIRQWALTLFLPGPAPSLSTFPSNWHSEWLSLPASDGLVDVTALGAVMILWGRGVSWDTQSCLGT